MAELTADTVRTIVEDVVQTAVGGLRADMTSGFEQVVATMQAFQDEDQDNFAEIRGRLSYHNQRIAKLERLSGLRE